MTPIEKVVTVTSATEGKMIVTLTQLNKIVACAVQKAVSSNSLVNAKLLERKVLKAFKEEIKKTRPSPTGFACRAERVEITKLHGSTLVLEGEKRGGILRRMYIDNGSNVPLAEYPFRQGQPSLLRSIILQLSTRLDEEFSVAEIRQLANLGPAISDARIHSTCNACHTRFPVFKKRKAHGRPVLYSLAVDDVIWRPA